MSKVAAIGEKEKILPLSSVGVEIIPLKDKEEADIINGVLKGDYAVVIVEEGVYIKYKELFDRVKGNMLPAVIPLPLGGESQDYGIKRLREMLIKAIGADIVGNK